MKSSESQTEYREEDIRKTSLEPRRRQNWWWLLILPLLLGGGYLGWRSFNGEKKAPAAASGPPPARVKLAPVQAGAIEDSSEFVASLESRQSVNLQPRVQGQVSQIFVKSGERVNSGDAIIQIDSRQQQAAVSTESASVEAANSQLDNARATLRSLQAQRLSNEADVKLEQQEYQRYTTLAAQGAVSRQTRDQYANRLATAQATLRSTDAQIQAQLATIAQAEKTIKQAQARTREQQVQLQYYKITAPFAGTVGDIPVKVGDFVNTSTQLTTITQNQPLEVNISVPIERGLQLRQGMPVEVLDAQGRTIGMSRIFFIASRASNNTQTVLVKSLFDNANDQLRADQFTRARIIWNQRLGVLVPATAIARIAGETFVYVTQTAQSPDGKSQPVARQKRVKLGSIKGNNYQVIEGLQPGERIIVSGLLNLRDGAPVVPES
ncbi:efflux RND transporter periplasmic adaptor subunit [Iningainema tapete]|uniref:Efflux RND transporter periplasmic adaptor subunit n=1 Tax=Iningainema tapete BLCC-T55 TaxID=2748662 RepID=A0A8J7BXR5_9CYAN|nr:efflux RND transporter periplasmic adaptor subunit [Iningainema tapete]MBD2774212.1 efflux RND transporter periplasmic adaptor subunit [Iningainema tapete BLCC-T55]